MARPPAPRVCPKGYLALNAELTKVPVCVASRAFIRRKLKLIEAHGGTESEIESVLAKACICHDLGGGATRKLGIEAESTPAICPGPNIVHFKRVLSLEQLVDHIYGRIDLLADTHRPHMFIAELRLNLDRLKQDLQCTDAAPRRSEHQSATLANLRDAISHYRALASRGEFAGADVEKQLCELERELEHIANGREQANHDSSAVASLC